MKLWNKGFEPDKAVEEYTVGQDRELDLRLAKYDVDMRYHLYHSIYRMPYDLEGKEYCERIALGL